MTRHYKPKQFLTPRMCGGKRCYAHKHEAEAVKEEQEVITPGLELRVYRCSICGQWHLTRNKDLSKEE
jgi:hypothetical protein